MGNVSRMTVNERKFIETALLNDLRIDGRRPFDYRPLTIKLGRYFFWFLLSIESSITLYDCFLAHTGRMDHQKCILVRLMLWLM